MEALYSACFARMAAARASSFSASAARSVALNGGADSAGSTLGLGRNERPDFPVAESERAGVLAAPDHLHFRASVRQIERYEAGSSEDARRIPRCLNGCCPELRKLTIGYLAGPD